MSLQPAELSVLKYHPTNIPASEPGWSHSVLDLKQVSLTHLSPPCLGRPRPGLSDSLLLGKFSLLHLIRAGAQSHLADWWTPSCKMWSQREVFNDNICLYFRDVSLSWGVRGSKSGQSCTKERGETTYQCVPGAGGGGGLGRLQT